MDTEQTKKFEEMARVVHEAFKDVVKGDSIGVREANSRDDYAPAEARAKAREEDSEQHWWDIPKEWQHLLGTALSFTDKHGFKFLLPAVITYGDSDSARFHLCFPYVEGAPHHGHKEYINYLKAIEPKKIAENYEFTQDQIHAIAVFLKWWMQEPNDYIYANREKKIDLLHRMHEHSKELPPENYNLTVEDEIAFFDEECRVLRDWLTLGGVEV